MTCSGGARTILAMAPHPLDGAFERVKRAGEHIERGAVMTVRSLDPALEHDGTGGRVVRLIALPVERRPDGLGHGSEYRESPEIRHPALAPEKG